MKVMKTHLFIDVLLNIECQCLVHLLFSVSFTPTTSYALKYTTSDTGTRNLCRGKESAKIFQKKKY